MSKKAFTLIELLVVIAIIGLLAAIVLVNVRGAKTKANDANIQSFIHQVRNAAEFYYIQNNESYVGVCDAENTLSNSGDLGILESAIKKENGNQDVYCFVSAGGKDFAASSPLVARQGKYWCVESAGASIEMDFPITSARCE